MKYSTLLAALAAIVARLLWRIRFTIYGQKKCPIGWRNWWAFSAATEWGWHDSPEEAADEELYAMAADA